MEEISNFSYRTDFMSEIKSCYWQNNGQIAFANAFGHVWVTPYRPEIREVLECHGYKEHCIYVPFSNSESRPEEYQWLAKIAEEECWAHTYETAFKHSQEKGIKAVKLAHKVHIKEIKSYFKDEDAKIAISPMTMMYLLNCTKANIGTYIFVDEKTLVLCDEYGRTFLLRSKTVINDIVNQLISAGYTRTIHPENYVQYVHSEPGTDAATEE